MKSLTKSLIVASVVGTLGTGALFTGAIASAETSTSTNNPMSSLVDKIASTFNLDKTKVQAVFDQQRSEMDAKRDAEVATRLNTLVSEGTITAQQKTAIEEKLAEMKKERESSTDNFKDMTDEQRKAAMDKKKSDLEAWAKEQGLDLTKLKGIFGHGGPRI